MGFAISQSSFLGPFFPVTFLHWPHLEMLLIRAPVYFDNPNDGGDQLMFLLQLRGFLPVPPRLRQAPLPFPATG